MAVPEAVRNRVLRRADWRFLLPNPAPVKSACFADGLLAQAVEAISRCAVDPRLDPSREDCDLAVAVDPDHETLQAAWGALRPGGACYTEWSSPISRPPSAIRERLEAAGFENVTFYSPWPNPSRSAPIFWWPLEAPGVLTYFLKNQPRPNTLAGWIRRAVRQAQWRMSRWTPLALPAPVCAIAHKPAAPPALRPSGREGAAAESGSLLETIRARWSGWGFGPTPARLFWFLRTGGGPTSTRSWNKVVAFVFADGDRQPTLAVKMPRIPESFSSVTNEAATLRALHERPGGVPGIPSVFSCEEPSGFPILAQSVVTGQPVYTILTRDRHRELALKAAAWLADLAGHGQPCPPESWWDRLVAPVFSAFESSFGPVLDKGMLRDTWDTLSTLGPMPLVCEQRDFSQWNTFLTGSGGLAVIDWESSELHGLPALDLFYFLTYVSLSLDGAWHPDRVRQSYRATADPSTPTGAVSQDCLSFYIGRTGLHPSNLPPLRLLVWMLHSRLEYRAIVADAGGAKPEAADLRRSFFVSLWEEELRNGSRR